MSRPKIFFIGFNRCGTTSLHRLMARSGANSVHYRIRRGPKMAPRMFSNLSVGLPIMAGFEQFETYSDFNYMAAGMLLEAQTLYPALYEEYPDSYFVLNTRNREKWLASRTHFAVREATMLSYAQEVLDMSEPEVLALWTRQWDTHHSDVPAFFAARPKARFMIFDIESQPIGDLDSFLAADYTLQTEDWKWRNKGTHRG